MRLVIDLSKGRPKGSTNKDHKWIARYMDMYGEWQRVYPDKRHGEFLPNGQFKLKPGVTINQVIHDVLLGGNTGMLDKKGRPVVREGAFLRYEIVPKSDLKNDHWDKETKSWKRVDYDKNAVSKEKVGDYVIFAYPKVSVTESEGDKPTGFAGFARIEYHPSVHAAGYRTPKKVEQFKFDASHIVKKEAVPKKGTPELPKHGETGPERGATMHPFPEGVSGITEPHLKKEHDHSTASIHRREALEGIEVKDDSDPFEIARKLYDKLTLKKKEKVAKPGTFTRANIPPEWVAKFDDEQQFLDKLQNQPVTTLVTLGVYKPTASTKKLNEALVEEWTGIVMGLSGDNFSAFKETDDYRTFARLDEKRQRAGKEAKHLRIYRRKVTGDLFQIGMEKLLKLSRSYETSDDPKKRFDKLAYASVQNAIRREAATLAEQRNSTVPIVSDSVIDQAMRENARGGGSMEPLSPHENTELQRVTPVARAALKRVIDKLPEAYKRVIAARLWLDEDDGTGVPLLDAAPSDEEKLSRKKRQAKLDAKIAEAEEVGETIKRERRSPKMSERDWTGPGSIVAKYRGWTDPVTDERFDMHEYSSHHQRALLQSYYEQGVAQVLRDLTVPLKRTNPGKTRPTYQPHAEWKQNENHVMVKLTPEELKTLTAEEQLTYIALGGEPRVLTQEGKAVKRYLQIETKLATQNRRRWMAPGHSREVDASVRFKPDPFKLVGEDTPKPRNAWKVEQVSPLSQPAIRFFTSSKNQELAQHLGLGSLTEHVEPHQRHVSPGKYADQLHRLARAHYKQYKKLEALDDSALKREEKTHTQRIKGFDRALDKVEDEDQRVSILRAKQAAVGQLALVQFVKQTRSTVKSMVITRDDDALSLVKAFYAYDFELDRLGVEF